MKKNYKIANEIVYGDRFIIVANYKIENMIVNYGTYNFKESYIEPNDVGVWKIKKVN
ncbi:hypothetical protein HWC88_gp50 [Flavobacterium phage vB_FspS_hattifnatt9-1]|uniref:Uncharacterized protein n=1 Tax=Flavobacterium phage vB_FspS_hattifnatt9-1 TaxID=2686246 RepID=A0A6B9LI64_9CAUD|nr:hypothetical protein HWC88_gp50 [Flavobacterium phage vB_FspS_hattifnatt9-1]QHB38735.1 hypothetical protein hattifnatt91_gp050 [Flavobacterium phage vB_FspS_hattifnatt9-1]